jgi:hypothetical protein
VEVYSNTGQGRRNVDLTFNKWTEHTECEWTWPNGFGVTGCLECGVVFETPTPEEAWLLDRTDGAVVGRAA